MVNKANLSIYLSSLNNSLNTKTPPSEEKKCFRDTSDGGSYIISINVAVSV